MAFIDELHIHATAGHGGAGVVRWLHLKGNEKAGPAGGDGGRGGDIVIVGIRDLAALANYRYAKKFRAENGGSGGNNDKHGADGAPTVLYVPVGTVATLPTSGEVFEVLEEGQRFVLFRGGVGGYGNSHFKGTLNQNPMQSTPGKAGQSGDIRLSLKIIADAGLVGFPNAGKSSLLNALTRAESKVGAYPFTTLDPNLGDFYGYILADIPGLIEGASTGRGLGSRFLKHIERTRFLIHLVSAEQENVVSAYTTIRNELKSFGRGLEEKEEILVLSQVDHLSVGEVDMRIEELKKASGKEVVPLSILDDTLLKNFKDHLTDRLRAGREAQKDI